MDAHKLTANSTLLLAIGTAALAVVAILQWLALHSTDEAIRKQAGIMERQLKEVQATRSQTDQLIEANVALAEAAKRQAEVSTENLKVVRQSMMLAQRAWVGPTGAKIEGALVAGKPLKSSVDYTNSGREPALNFNVNTVVVVFSKQQFYDGTASLEINATQKRCLSLKPSEQGSTIYAGGSKYTWETTHNDFVVKNEITSGDKIIVLLRCFAYKSFGEDRQSASCHFYERGFSNKDELSICPTGNYAN